MGGRAHPPAALAICSICHTESGEQQQEPWPHGEPPARQNHSRPASQLRSPHAPAAPPASLQAPRRPARPDAARGDALAGPRWAAPAGGGARPRSLLAAHHHASPQRPARPTRAVSGHPTAQLCAQPGVTAAVWRCTRASGQRVPLPPRGCCRTAGALCQPVLLTLLIAYPAVKTAALTSSHSILVCRLHPEPWRRTSPQPACAPHVPASCRRPSRRASTGPRRVLRISLNGTAPLAQRSTHVGATLASTWAMPAGLPSSRAPHHGARPPARRASLPAALPAGQHRDGHPDG